MSSGLVDEAEASNDEPRLLSEPRRGSGTSSTLLINAFSARVSHQRKDESKPENLGLAQGSVASNADDGRLVLVLVSSPRSLRGQMSRSGLDLVMGPGSAPKSGHELAC